MGVVIRRWVWLECIGVISGWCCKEVYRLITTPLVLALFCSSIPTFVHFLMFFHSCLGHFCAI